MSKPADKAANRSAIKARWSESGFSPRKPTPPASSWWIAGAAPDAREEFVKVARARDAEQQWTTLASTNTKAFQ